MRRFAKLLKRDDGYSLIELIAALSLLTIVMGVIYSTITFGVNAYHRVQIQNSLRDEGDLAMSSMMTKLYTYGPDKLVQTSDGILLLSGLVEQKTEMKLQTDEQGNRAAYHWGSVAAALLIAGNGRSGRLRYSAVLPRRCSSMRQRAADDSPQAAAVLRR